MFVNGLPARLWADSKDGASPVETVLIREVIPGVDRSFRTQASREGRILEGFSMGGYGAARLGFKHPELFAGPATDVSGSAWSSSASHTPGPSSRASGTTRGPCSRGWHKSMRTSIARPSPWPHRGCASPPPSPSQGLRSRRRRLDRTSARPRARSGSSPPAGGPARRACCAPRR
ncbi:MAG: alpha/beta hydrolase-fold protein [Rubrivivax sp.]